MQVPRLDSSSEVYDDCAEFTCTALELDENPAVAALAPDLRAEQQRVSDAAGAVKSRQRMRVRKQAECAVLRERFHRLAGRFNLAILVRCRNNRKSQFYKDFLPDGLTGLRRVSAEELPSAMRWIIDALNRLGEDPLATEFVPQIQALLEQYQAALAHLQQADYELEQVRAAEDAVKQAWITVYRRIYGALLMLFTDDKGLVEAFFKQVGNSRRKRNNAAENSTATA